MVSLSFLISYYAVAHALRVPDERSDTHCAYNTNQTTGHAEESETLVDGHGSGRYHGLEKVACRERTVWSPLFADRLDLFGRGELGEAIGALHRLT